MEFEKVLSDYQALRLKIIPLVRKRLPDDPAEVAKDRAELEEYFFDAMEAEADFESFFLKRAAMEYEKESVGSWDYACALHAEEKSWQKKALAAVKAIESRSIKLSQNRKLTEQR